MATRADLRSALQDKLLGLEDSGYGDFEFSDSELNTYLALSVSRLYPALYKRLSHDDLELSEYGTAGYAEVTVDYPERVFLIEDATEKTLITGWEMRPTTIVKLDTELYATVNVYYHDAYELPDDDVTDLGASAQWTPVIVLGALVEALESRQDSGVRGDPAPVGNLHEVPLLDRLVRRYEAAREELAMSLPAVAV